MLNNFIDILTESFLLFKTFVMTKYLSSKSLRSFYFVSLVRGSEGLYMVNGPPHFTESTVFPRYDLSC